MVDHLAMHASDEALPAHLLRTEMHATDAISIRILTAYEDHSTYKSVPRYLLILHLLTYLDGSLMTTLISTSEVFIQCGHFFTKVHLIYLRSLVYSYNLLS